MVSGAAPLDAAPTTAEPVNLLGASRAIVVAVSILMLAVGLLGSTIAVRAEQEGFATSTIGLLGSANYAGFLLGALVGPRLVARVGHIRVYSAVAAIASASILILPSVISPLSWLPARFMIGLCLSCIYVVVESWLNSVSTNENRGQLLAVYLVSTNLMIGGGQVLFATTDPLTVTPFLLASAIASLSVVPLALSVVPPPIHDSTRINLPIRVVFRVAPLAPATSFISGFGVGVIIGLSAIYASQAGMNNGRIGLFVAMSSIGGIVLQIPIGRWSDRVPRRQVILYVNVAAAAVALVGSFLSDSGIGIFIAIAMYAAIAFPLYSLAIAHLNDVVDSTLRTAAGGVLILSFGLGSMIGPYIGSLLMGWQSRGFWIALVASNVAILPYLGYRIVTRPRIPQRRKHVPLNAEVTPAHTILLEDLEPIDGRK